MLFLGKPVRDIAFAFALAMLSMPYPGWAQQPAKVWRVGYLSTISGPDEAVDALREQLRKLGYVEGRNIAYEYRWAAGRPERVHQ